MSTRFGTLLSRLTEHGVEFVVIGGLAVIAHGHIRTTADLDVCYARTPENVRRLVAALADLSPRLRGAPPELPFFWDEKTVKNGLNFTLVTSLGELDLLLGCEVSGAHEAGALDRAQHVGDASHARVVRLDSARVDYGRVESRGTRPSITIASSTRVSAARATSA
jgi:hypothetical protein